jgi:adenine-specific DNA-methyltransferase
MTTTDAPPVFHRLWHGDSVELCAKIPFGKVNCVIVDPPFGTDNQSNMATTAEGKANARKIANDLTPEQAIKNFNAIMDVLLPRAADNADMYVFTSHQVLKEWLQVIDDLGCHGFSREGILVWQKDGPGMGDLDGCWGMAHEFILYLKKGRRPRSAPRRTGVFHIPQVRPKDLIHPHEKPLALLGEFIRFSTSPGDFIVDPCAGSFSTIRAARAEGRSALGIELDKHNFDVASEKFHTAESALC